MARDTDGTIRQATSLGTFADDTITLRNRLNSATSDFRDFYSFNLAVRSRVNIAVGLLQDNVALALLNSQGRKLEVSNRAGDRPERIQRELNDGTYYIAVVLFGTRTSYGMRIRPKPLEALPAPPGVAPVEPPPDGEDPTAPLPPGPAPIIPSPDPGPIPARAFDIGVLNAPVAYQQSVGGVDTNGDGLVSLEEIDFGDYYRFTLTQPAEVTIVTGNVSEGTVNTSLVYDLNGNGALDTSEDARFTEILASGTPITRSLGAGTYFIGVELGDGGNVTYSFQLSQTPITDINFTSFPPTLGLQTAVDLGNIDSGTQSVRQLIGTTNPIDIYKFSLTNQATNVSLLLDQTQLIGDVTLSIVYDVNNDGIASPTRQGFDSDGDVVEGIGDFVAGTFTAGAGDGATLTLRDTLTSGTYYLVVTQRSIPADNTPYNLQFFTDPVVLNPVPDPTHDLPTATAVNLIPLSTVANRDPANFTQITQVVGASDKSDIYRFTVASESNVIISYRGQFAPVGLQLARDLNGNNVIDVPEDGTGFAIVDGNIEQFGERNGILDSEDTLIVNGVLDTEDVNGNGILDLPEVDLNGDGIVDPNEDLNGNGVFDTLNEDTIIPNGVLDSEDENQNGVFDTEDRNGNLVLDRNEVLEPEPTINTQIYGEFPVEYNPLPPFPLPSNGPDAGRGGVGYEIDPTGAFVVGDGGFEFTNAYDDLTNAYITGSPTLIYARLTPGTYYLNVENLAFRPVDLGDGVRRTGPFPGNVYSVSFFLDG
jgi:hypothetical protein